MTVSIPSSVQGLPLEALKGLAAFRGAPADYWRSFVTVARDVCGAEAALLYWHKADPSGLSPWKLLEQTGAEANPPELRSLVSVRALSEARALGGALAPQEVGTGEIGVVPLQVEDATSELVLVLRFVTAAAPTRLRWLGLLGWLPLLYERDRGARVSRRDATRLAQVIELVGRLLAAESFDAACLVLANDLAEKFACETVSVSWRGRIGLKLRAISHAEKLERRSELSALVEEAGQEALSLGTEITWPGRGASIGRAHDRYARLQHPGHMITLPLIDLRPEAEPGTANRRGAITLERQRMAFTAAEQWALRLACELALQPLEWQAARARRLPVRLWAEVVRSLPAALRPRTVSGKRLALAGGALMLALAAMPLPYRVSGSAVIKADQMAYVGAPFDGFMEESFVEPGDIVTPDAPLFALATRELLLEKGAMLADLVQAEREAEMRRSLNQLPEMQMAEAQAAEIRAKIEQTELRLQSARAHAPFEGVVVEGEPGKQLGAALRRGDPVVTIASLAKQHVEIAIPERSLSSVAEGQPVEVSFLAQPQDSFAMSVERVIPSATIQEGENRFPIRLTDPQERPLWWIPGMTGVAKVSVGWRPLGWIATHRIIDYFRLVFWI